MLVPITPYQGHFFRKNSLQQYIPNIFCPRIENNEIKFALYLKKGKFFMTGIVEINDSK